MPRINPLLAGVETPPIPEAHAWARRYDGQFGPLLDLCQAVPGYAPHPDLLQHAAQAATDPANAKYGLIPGDLALREAYIAELAQTYGAPLSTKQPVSTDQVAITAGCNQAFFLAILTLAEPGDNVILPVPWFWNHQQTCTMLGIEPRPLPCAASAAFVPDPDDAARLIDARTRAIVLITPNNPTGAVYPPATIARFAELCHARGIMLILDETYRDFLPDNHPRAHALFQDPAWPSHLLQLYSFSKAYCIPGHRMGAIVADTALIREFVKVLDCMHICPQRASQAALTWAIPNLPKWRDRNRETMNRRADAMRLSFANLHDANLHDASLHDNHPDDGQASWRIDSLGAYFAYVRHPCPERSAAQVAERLATALGAVGLPGSAFGPGQERHVRLAFANVETPGILDLASRLSHF